MVKLKLPMMGQVNIIVPPLCCDTLRKIHHLSDTLAQIIHLNEETIRQKQINGHLKKQQQTRLDLN